MTVEEMLRTREMEQQHEATIADPVELVKERDAARALRRSEHQGRLEVMAQRDEALAAATELSDRIEVYVGNAYSAGIRDTLNRVRAAVEAEGHSRFCETEDATPSFDYPCTCWRGRMIDLIRDLNAGTF